MLESAVRKIFAYKAAVLCHGFSWGAKPHHRYPQRSMHAPGRSIRSALPRGHFGDIMEETVTRLLFRYSA